MPEHSETRGVGVRQVAQQYAVDHREDRRIRADPEGESEDGHGCEAGTPAQGPEGIAEVLYQRVHIQASC
jgi:hypothetical protein